MSVLKTIRHSLNLTATVLAAIALTGCASLSGGSSTVGSEHDNRTLGEARPLKEKLVTLAPTVREEDAEAVANCAYRYSRQLAHEYHAVRPAIFHNFLVNVGIKKRGLCYQWTEDLLAQLQTLNVSTLELRWGMARAGTLREHNSVVVTACGQPFEQGIVLDPWRRSGRLVWKPVVEDKYPWVEGELVPFADATGTAAQLVKQK